MPARHCRVGFVSSSIDNAVEVLAAVAAQLRKDASKDKWTLPKHGAHFRSSGVATQGKVRAATGLEHAPRPWPLRLPSFR